MTTAPASQADRAQGWSSVIGLLLLVTLWRFYQVRQLALPAWVDSVHHTLLVRILLEQWWLPNTWGPYLPDTPFYYHFGFHASAALLAWLTGMTGLELGNAVLIAGQLWQVLLVLAIYLLARALLHEHEPAFIAMLLVSFVAEMPAFYVSWGRYPLLAGATLLILAMAAVTAHRWRWLTMLIALTAITHHYILLLLIIFLVVSWLLTPGQRIPLFCSGTAAAILVSPWLWRVWRLGQHWAGVETRVDDDSRVASYLLTLLGPLPNYSLLLIAFIGYFLIVRHMRHGSTPWRAWLPLGVWTVLLVAFLGPWELQPFRADHAALLLFLPAVLFASAALSQIRQSLYRWALILLLLLWGMWATRNIVHPATILASADDVAALRWLAVHTAPDARFLVDVAPWFGLWRGVDGGWWITPLTGRPTVLPPLAYAWSKAAILTNYTTPAATLATLYTSPPASYCARLLTLMHEVAADYYYTHMIQPQSCPLLRVVYHSQAGIQLYQRLD